MSTPQSSSSLPSADGCTPNQPLAALAARMRAHELNMISEYLYQSIIFADTLRELSDFFENLAGEEMEHHRALTRLILALGADPAERSAVRTSAGLVPAEDKPSHAPVAAARCLRANIAAEERDAEDYAALAQTAERVGQAPAAAIFRAICAEEKEHAARQRRMLR